MAEEKDIIETLLQQGFTKREIDAALYKAVMWQIKNGKKELLKGGLDETQNNFHNNNYREKHIIQEMLKQVQQDARQEILKQVQDDAPHDVTTPKKNHPNPVVRFLKRIDIRKHISGKALSLLKSQFAKKPKNPV